ncbi:MAG: zinc ABC transporter substrate-binding protein [Leptolyngbyaceae bacterium]|nr:zinc ABC transporter substrate-binding protein [Leptolyngbyaceae bacterium]
MTQRPALRPWMSAALVLVGLWSSGCDLLPQSTPTTNGTPLPNTNAQPPVVATSTIITNLTQQIGGDEIDVAGILKPGDDPHVYEPVPADSRKLEKAALIFYNGYNLEPNLIKMMNATGVRARKVAVGEVVKPLELKESAKGTVPDPHVWGDVKNVIQMAELIRDELIQLSPEDQAEFKQNANTVITELQQLDRWVTQQIQTIPVNQRQLITTHDAFQYYAKAYGLTVAGTLIGISTEEQPSAQTVKQLAESIKSLGVTTIFAETTINPRLITTVAEEAGVQLAPTELYSDSIGTPGSAGDSYVKMIVSNTEAIVKYLGGQPTPFKPSSAGK